MTTVLRRSGIDARAAFRGWDRFDAVMALAALALVVLGLLLIHSGSKNEYSGPVLSFANPVVKQIVFAIFGLGAMVTMSRVDYHRLTHYWWVWYGLSILALLAVLLVGQTQFGSTRWFDVGPVQVQPSEFAKIAVIIALAKFFAEYGGDAREVRALVTSLAIATPVALLIFVEPDLGTAAVTMAIWLGVVVVAGVNRAHLAVLAAMCLAMAPFLWTFAVADYQAERVGILVDPYRDQGGLGAGYNVIQAETAIGSGGLFGKGLGNGQQTQLEFLKVPTKDFIFSVLGEELGFAGAMGLFALYILLLWRGIRAAQIAGDTAGQLLAVGIVVLILTQTFINVAVNVGLFPVTGIPLPFVSQGGSSLVALFASLGILQSVILRHRSYRQL